jgi:hypothetical protein
MNAIEFGRWLLKNTIAIKDDGNLFWMYNFEKKSTEDMYKIAEEEYYESMGYFRSDCPFKECPHIITCMKENKCCQNANPKAVRGEK